MTRILVVNLTRFGDIIQSTPMIQGLKIKFPDSYITLLVNSNFSEVCSMLPGVDDILELDFNMIWGGLCVKNPAIDSVYGYLKNIFIGLRENKIDRVINITPHDIGIISSFLAGDRASFREKLSSWTMYYLSTSRHWATLPYNIVDVYIKLAELEPQRILPKVQISPLADRFAARLLKLEGHQANDVLIGFHSGASSLDKQWPLENFLELAVMIKDRLNAKVILYGSQSEKQLAEFLQKEIGDSVINAVGRTSVADLAALLSKTDILITNDSGPMHLASACGTKIISLHMGKEKCASTGPYGEGHIALQPKIECHPCKNPQICPNGYCRDIISPGLVFKIIRSIIDKQYGLCHKDIEGDLKHSDVFVSGFDKRNLLDCLPLLRSELSFSKLCDMFLRFMWDNVLCFNHYEKEIYFEISQYTDEIITVIENYYCADNFTKLNKQWRKIDKALETLIALSRQGALLSRTLESKGHDAVGNLPTLQKMSKEIEIADKRIISLGERFKEISAVTHMFSFEKENLEGRRLIELARHTEHIYKGLQERCRILRDIGSCFFGKVFSAGNINNKMIA